MLEDTNSLDGAHVEKGSLGRVPVVYDVIIAKADQLSLSSQSFSTDIESVVITSYKLQNVKKDVTNTVTGVIHC